MSGVAPMARATAEVTHLLVCIGGCLIACYTDAMTIQPISVADAVADELRHRLLAGAHRGGEPLRDTDLSVEFGVARPTVRAAVQMLVADGLLERGRGRSAEVRSLTAEDAVDPYREGVQATVDAFLSCRRICRGRSRPTMIVFHRAVPVASSTPSCSMSFAPGTPRAQSVWSEHFDVAERFFLTLIQERTQ
jgi:DNA-binding transcriptional regulator YhcF (GntR family)